jgi:alpha-amylase
MAENRATALGDFHNGVYTAKLRQNPNRVQVQLERTGTVDGRSVKLTKGLTLNAGGEELEVAYLLEGVPDDCQWIFGVEFNFAGLPAGADDRFFHMDQQRLGRLETRLDLEQTREIGLADRWQGIEIGLTWDSPAQLWTFPIETVSQSEGGFELVHQSIVVLPHWRVVPDPEGRWAVTMRMKVDTSRAAPTVPRNAVVAI